MSVARINVFFPDVAKRQHVWDFFFHEENKNNVLFEIVKLNIKKFDQFHSIWSEKEEKLMKENQISQIFAELKELKKFRRYDILDKRPKVSFQPIFLQTMFT